MAGMLFPLYRFTVKYPICFPLLPLFFQRQKEYSTINLIRCTPCATRPMSWIQSLYTVNCPLRERRWLQGEKMRRAHEKKGGPGMVFQGADHRHENATQNTLQWIQLEGRKSLFESSLQEWRPFLVQKDSAIVFLSYRNPSSLISKRKQTQNMKNSKSTCTFRCEKQWRGGQSQNTRGWWQPRFCQCWTIIWRLTATTQKVLWGLESYRILPLG